MKRIVITREDFAPGEAQAIAAMLAQGIDRMHVRKPGSSRRQTEALLEAIPQTLRQRISLHDHLELAAQYGVGGVHLNSRNSIVPRGFHGLVSRSCHSIDELQRHAGLDYLFLSPVFDSISKAGYRAAFSLKELSEARRERLIDSHVYALGGVFPGNFAQVENMGFGGAVMAGAAHSPVPMRNFALQYIAGPAEDTPDRVESTCRGAVAALAGGCRWIQIRMKDSPDEEVAEATRRLAPECLRRGATLLIDDRVHLVAPTGAHGVHLGKNDMPPAHARHILGPGYIIGATANTAADIAQAHAAGADYIGLGPFRFTTTKKNLSPVLGTAGYRDVIADIRRRGISLPVVAIGGITPSDIEALAASGVQGVAVSGAIARAANPAGACGTFINSLTTNKLWINS